MQLAIAGWGRGGPSSHSAQLSSHETQGTVASKWRRRGGGGFRGSRLQRALQHPHESRSRQVAMRTAATERLCCSQLSALRHGRPCGCPGLLRGWLAGLAEPRAQVLADGAGEAPLARLRGDASGLQTEPLVASSRVARPRRVQTCARPFPPPQSVRSGARPAHERVLSLVAGAGPALRASQEAKSPSCDALLELDSTAPITAAVATGRAAPASRRKRARGDSDSGHLHGVICGSAAGAIAFVELSEGSADGARKQFVRLDPGGFLVPRRVVGPRGLLAWTCCRAAVSRFSLLAPWARPSIPRHAAPAGKHARCHFERRDGARGAECVGRGGGIACRAPVRPARPVGSRRRSVEQGEGVLQVHGNCDGHGDPGVGRRVE